MRERSEVVLKALTNLADVGAFFQVILMVYRLVNQDWWGAAYAFMIGVGIWVGLSFLAAVLSSLMELENR